jgi:hypothetical protein
VRLLKLPLYFQISRGYQLPLPVGEVWGEGFNVFSFY